MNRTGNVLPVIIFLILDGDIKNRRILVTASKFYSHLNLAENFMHECFMDAFFATTYRSKYR